MQYLLTLIARLLIQTDRNYEMMLSTRYRRSEQRIMVEGSNNARCTIYIFVLPPFFLMSFSSELGAQVIQNVYVLLTGMKLDKNSKLFSARRHETQQK